MMNFLHFMWYSYSFIVTISGLNFLYVKCSPQILKELYAFGKVHNTLQKQQNILRLLEIPKRWFSHFYMFACVYISLITLCVCLKYFGVCTCLLLNDMLDMFSSTNRHSDGNVSPESVIIVGVLLSVQVMRRCYECLYISVYSDARMNVTHYIVGLTFYFGVGLSFIHDAPGFESNNGHPAKIYVTGEWFLWRHYIGILLFLVAFVLQFETHKAFASLRKKGESVVSFAHFMPSGGAFEYISCPHYFAEIVMYLSASLILGGKSFTWWLVCLWVISNQVVSGLTSHHWYHEKFKDYPANRKAVIPFLL